MLPAQSGWCLLDSNTSGPLRLQAHPPRSPEGLFIMYLSALCLLGQTFKA